MILSHQSFLINDSEVLNLDELEFNTVEPLIKKGSFLYFFLLAGK